MLIISIVSYQNCKNRYTITPQAFPVTVTVTFDTLLESKILDASDILISSNLQKPWTTVAKMSIEHLILNNQHTVYLTGLSYVNAPSQQVITS